MESVTYKNRSEVGSCNFCADKNHRKVFEMKSSNPHGGSLARICNNCLDTLCNEAERRLAISRISKWDLTVWQKNNSLPAEWVRLNYKNQIVARVTQFVGTWHEAHNPPFVGIEVWHNEVGNGCVSRETSPFHKDNSNLSIDHARRIADKILNEETNYKLGTLVIED